MLEPHPDFDPHDLKHGGAKTQRSAHVNEPYVYQEFPKVIYKKQDDETLTLTVNDKEALEKALGDGYHEKPVAG